MLRLGTLVFVEFLNVAIADLRKLILLNILMWSTKPLLPAARKPVKRQLASGGLAGQPPGQSAKGTALTASDLAHLARYPLRTVPRRRSMAGRPLA